MAKEDINAMKKFHSTPDKVITITTSLSREMSLNKNDEPGSRSRSRKSSNYLFRRNSEKSTEPIDDTSLKKNLSFSGTPTREKELQRQSSKKSQKSIKSSSQVVQALDMKAVCECMTEFERCLKKRAQLSREKNKSSDSEGKPGQVDMIKSNRINKNTTNTSVVPTLPGDDLEPHELITRTNNPLDNGLISESSANPALPRNSSITSQRESANNSTIESGNKSKVTEDSTLPRSKSRISRKSTNISTDSDRALSRSTSRVSKKLSKEHSVNAELPSRTSIDGASARKTSRKVSTTNNSTRTSADLQISLAKNNSQPIRSKSRNNPEKTTPNRASFTKISKTSVEELANKGTNKVERNSSKNLSKPRSRSESINNSTRRRSEANNPQNQQPPATNESAPANVEPSSTEPVINNPQTPIQNTDSNTAANNGEPNVANTNQQAPLPNENQQSAVPAATEDQPNATNDTVPSVQSNHDDERFTSPSNRQLNPQADIQQSSRETRTQPIPTNPNSENAAKHNLEAWLQSTASQSDTPQPRKSSVMQPYPKFPVIRPCDKDITVDPEDCKKKLEQKLERMYKLKQAYYADPEDNIPFINLAYTKEGVFVDEPIERAFVFDEAFLKPNENSPNPDSTQVSLESKSNQSKSAFFSPIWLNSRNDTPSSSSFSNSKFVKKESSHSKWMDKIFEEAEINMIENVLHDFQHKFNKLAASVRTMSSSSETSSISEPVRRSRKRILIPNRSSRSNN